MEELVRSFVGGQMSRRVFIRRLVAAGVALSGAIAYADLLQADPARAAANYVNVADYMFYPAKVTLTGPGDYAYWSWFDASGHTVTDTTGSDFFDSSPNPNAFGGWDWVTSFSRGFWASGTWTYECKDALHTPMTGKIRVPMMLSKSSGRAPKTITLTYGAFGLGGSPTWRYEVQLRKPGGAWKDWVLDGTAPTKDYTAKAEGKHEFRARLRNTGTGQASGWSPVATFTAR